MRNSSRLAAPPVSSTLNDRVSENIKPMDQDSSAAALRPGK